MIQKGNLLEFGQALRVQKFCFYCWGVLWGQFCKTKNTPGKVCDESASSEKAQCLAQVSYEKSNHKLRVLDI